MSTKTNLRSFILIGAVFLCGAMSQSETPTDPTLVSCDGQAAATLIGQEASLLDELGYEGPMRIIRPDDAVTMDYQETRLNILLDQNDRIQRAYCG